MIKIILPNFYFYNNLNLNFLNLNLNYPNYFLLENINIESCEGTFPFNFWDGSGLNNLKSNKMNNFITYNNICQNFLNYSFKIGFDISNIYLSENDILYNTQLNTILELLHNGSNYLITNNSNYIDILNKKYPYYYYTGSLFYQNDNDKIIRKKVLLQDLIKDNINLNKSKTEIVLPLKCGKCDQFIECKKKEMLQQFSFSRNSLCNNCVKELSSLDYSNIIKEYNQKGYNYFSFDITGIPKNNINFMIDFYCKTFIKPEYYFQAYYFLEGNKKI